MNFLHFEGWYLWLFGLGIFSIHLKADYSFLMSIRWGSKQKWWYPKYCPQDTSKHGLQEVRQIFEIFES